ncbi:MAG: ATP-binding protein [Planctomycetia bacterium]|nr:ATP-binding protein [Planctomycetia bacterium]
MFNDLQLFSLGAAAVIDTVLLMALIERPNRRHVAIWMIVLTAAAWLWHSGSFVHTLLVEATHAWPLRVNALSMTAMSVGVLLMPSSMLHGAIRLWHTGVEAKPRSDARYWLCYLPLFALGPMARNLFADPSGEYLTLVAPFTTSFVFWLCATNLIAAATFWRLRRRVALSQATAFFRGMAGMLCGLSVLVVFVVFVAVPQWPEQAEAWKLIASLSPVLPALLFAYHVVRFGFVPLVLERTLVYSAVLAAAFLFHHFALADVTNRLSEQLRVDFAIVEAVAAAALIVSYQPLRQRVAEALRYLLGSRVAGVREQTRQLAARMSEGIEPPVDHWLAAIIEEVRILFGVEHAGCWLFGDSDRISGSATSGKSLSGEQAIAMQQLVTESGQRVLTRFVATDPAAQSLLSTTGTSAAITFDHRDLCGLLVLGRKQFNQELDDESLSSLVLLTEQLAVTLRNARLQQDRLTAERRALRQEKLSTLGLLASSIAHEIKNPLSSIRTISTVMAEDLGADSPHAEDLRLIISEIDRLAATTRQLLEFARPAPAANGSCVPRELLDRTLRILRHLAQQKGVRLETTFDDDYAAVRADPESLGEIFFNLLSNSIDAVGTGGVVRVSCRTDSNVVVVQIHDTGAGLPPEVQDHLFEPFVTTKLDGTGLGLYIVGRRIRELGAEIRCESTPGEGTSFEVRLPK